MTTGKKKRQWVLAEFCEFWEHQILNAIRRVRSCAALHPTECPPHADRSHAHVVYALARTGNIERALKALTGSDVSLGRRRRRSWRPSLPTSCCNKHFSTGQPKNGRSASRVAFSWLGTTGSRICQPHMPCWGNAP